MKKSLKLTLTALLLLPLQSILCAISLEELAEKNKVIECNDFKLIKKVLIEISKKNVLNGKNRPLVVFDIDYTLLEMNPEKQFRNKLCDKELPKLIKTFLKKGIPAIALTASPFKIPKESALKRPKTPSCKKPKLIRPKTVPCMINTETTGLLARGKELKDLGIKFNPEYKSRLFFEFTELNVGYLNGVLYSNRIQKGEVLAYFIFERANKSKPNLVIFVDDKLLNCKSVLQAMNEAEIPCISLHYQNKNKEKIEAKIKAAKKTNE